MASDALKRQIETIADQAIDATALVDRLLPLAIDLDWQWEDHVRAYRARQIVEGLHLRGRNLSDDTDEAGGRADPTLSMWG